MTPEEKMNQLGTVWLEANYERCQRLYEKLRDKVWVLRGGYSEIIWGERPKPVPNPSMPWERPCFADMAHRLWAWEERKDGLIKKRQRDMSLDQRSAQKFRVLHYPVSERWDGVELE